VQYSRSQKIAWENSSIQQVFYFTEDTLSQSPIVAANISPTISTSLGRLLNIPVAVPVLNETGRQISLARTVGNNEAIKIGVDRQEKVGNNESLEVGNNQQIKIGNDRSEDVGNNETIKIGSNRNTTIGDNDVLSVGLTRTHSVGINEAINIGAAQEISVGAVQIVSDGIAQINNIGLKQKTNAGKEISLSAPRIILNATEELTLKCGAGVITFDAAGNITIKAPLVKINT